MHMEKKAILETLATGKISVDDAEKLLNGLDYSEVGPSHDTTPSPSGKLRFVRIAVDAPGAEQVNVRFPLAFLRGGMKVLGILPADACEKLIEFSELGRDVQDATESQKSLFEIECENKKKVRVCFE